MAKPAKPSPSELPDWPERLYPKVASLVREAYAVFASADDASVKAVMQTLLESEVWPRMISNLREIKTVKALRSRLMHKVMFNLYPPHIVVVFRLACLLDPSRGEALLARALKATARDPHIHGDLLEIAFDGGVSSSTMDKLVDTLTVQCDPWWITYVGEAIARSPVPTKLIAARFYELAAKPDDANKTSLIQLCAASILRDAAYRKDVTALSKRANESIADALGTLLKNTKSPAKSRA